MRAVRNGMLAFIAALALAATGVACDNTREGAREDSAEAQRDAEQKARQATEGARDATQDAQERARQGTRDANEAAREAGREGAEGAREAGREVGGTAREAGREAQGAAGRTGAAIGAAGETIDVKAALMADETVDATNINVDTFADRKTVVLRGSVPTQAQKDAAGKIASREAEGYKVDNQLTVRPR